MSTRKLNLFVTAAALALAGGVTAASASIAAPPPPADGTTPSADQPAEMPALPGAPTPPTPAVSLPASSASAQDGAADAADDPSECRDADCVIALKGDQEIALDKKFGIESVRVTTDGDDITFTVRTKTSKAVATLDANTPHGNVYFNGIRMRPYKTGTGKLMLEISRA